MEVAEEWRRGSLIQTPLGTCTAVTRFASFEDFIFFMHQAMLLIGRQT